MPAFLATPLAKLVSALLLVSLMWGWGYFKGRADMRTKWEASLARQAERSAAQIVEEATMAGEILAEHARDSRDAEVEARVIEREVIRYVQRPDAPCSVDPEFVRLFDELSRLPVLRSDGVPPADPSPGTAAEPPETGLTAAEVLQAYQRAVDELLTLWIDYAALVEWERNRYALHQAAYEGTR